MDGTPDCPQSQTRSLACLFSPRSWRFWILGGLAAGAALLVLLALTTSLLDSPKARAAKYIGNAWTNFIQRDWSDHFTSPVVLVSVGAMLLSIVLEWIIFSIQERSLAAGLRRSSLYRLLFARTGSTWNDLWLYIYFVLAVDGIVIPVLALFGPILVYWSILKFCSFQLFVNTTFPFVHFLLFLLVEDFLQYWLHRAHHEWYPLWQLHKYHHSATEFNMITTTREHPVEKSFQWMVSAIPLAIIGEPLQMYLAYLGFRAMQTAFLHSAIGWHFGPLDRFINSPRAHHIHHSVEEVHWDKNYGSLLTLWDWLFGTYSDGEGVQPRLGVTKNYFNERNTLYDLWMPVPMFFIALFNLEGNQILEPRPSEDPPLPKAA